MEQKQLHNKPQRTANPRNRQKTFGVNTALLGLGLVVSLSGLMLQIHYHLLKAPAESSVFGFDRAEWNAMHVWASVFFLVAVISHLWAHRKWYETVLRRQLSAKHRLTLALSVLVVLVVVSGFIPWLMLCLGGHAPLRFSLIEIHDKVAILFFVVVVCHTFGRRAWYGHILRSQFR